MSKHENCNTHERHVKRELSLANMAPIDLNGEGDASEDIDRRSDVSDYQKGRDLLSAVEKLDSTSKLSTATKEDGRL